MSQDDFADVRDVVEGLGSGILAGEGSDFHNKVKSSISPDGTGYDYKIRCDKCGRTLCVSVPWGELAIMGQGMLPPNQEWQYDQMHGCLTPTKGCPRDGDPIRLGLTPDECNRNLSSGIAARKITREQIQTFLSSIRR